MTGHTNTGIWWHRGREYNNVVPPGRQGRPDTGRVTKSHYWQPQVG